MSGLSIDINNDAIALSGELTRRTVETLNQKSHKKIVKNTSATVDLKAVTKVDTAGLAWLLYLIESATKTKCQLTFAHLPDDLLKLAKLSAVDGFFNAAA